VKICQENRNLVKIWHSVWKVTNNLLLLGNKIALKKLLSTTRKASLQHDNTVSFPAKRQYLLHSWHCLFTL